MSRSLSAAAVARPIIRTLADLDLPSSARLFPEHWGQPVTALLSDTNGMPFVTAATLVSAALDPQPSDNLAPRRLTLELCAKPGRASATYTRMFPTAPLLLLAGSHPLDLKSLDLPLLDADLWCETFVTLWTRVVAHVAALVPDDQILLDTTAATIERQRAGAQSAA